MQLLGFERWIYLLGCLASVSSGFVCVFLDHLGMLDEHVTGVLLCHYWEAISALQVVIFENVQQGVLDSAALGLLLLGPVR